MNKNQSIETLLAGGVPRVVADAARRRALAENREVGLADLPLVYIDETGQPDQVLLNQSIAESVGCALLTTIERIQAETELRFILNHRFQPVSLVDQMTAILNAPLAQSSPVQQELTTSGVPPDSGRVVTEASTSLVQSAALGGQNVLPIEPTGIYKVGMSGVPFVPAKLDPVALRRGQSTSSSGAWNDFVPEPNWVRLGISRDAGPATDEEMMVLAGATRMDGSPLLASQVYSTGACYGDINILEDRWRFIPPVELGRIGFLMNLRPKGSDTDHKRQALDSSFISCMAMMGMDRDTPLHPDHPLLGRVPYIALTGRALFPFAEQDERQLSALEAVRTKRVQRTSMLFAFTTVACGTCGEIPIRTVYKAEGQTIGLGFSPSDSPSLFGCADCEYRLYIEGIVRYQADVPGGFIYREILINAVTSDGVMVIDPVSFAIPEGAALLIRMENIFWFGGANVPQYCPFHYLEGMVMRDGTRTVGAFCNVQQLLNVALTDQGAINNARMVPAPRPII